MDEQHVFRKTAKGAAELQARSSALSQKHRRCLILMDGRKNARELAGYFRPGEFIPIIRDLVERGLVEPPAGGLEDLAGTPSDFPRITLERFLEIRRQAQREISDRLGPAGDEIAMKVGGCATPEALRVALRDAEIALRSFLGAEYAQAFVKRVGKALMG